MKSSRLNARTILLLLVEAMLLFTGLIIAVYVRLGAIDAEDALIVRHGFYKAALATILCLTSFYLFDLYDFIVMHDRGELVLRLLQALGLAWIALALLFYAVPQVMIGRGVSLIALPIALLLMVGWRLAIHWVLGHPELGERILIVGSGSFAVEIARETLNRPDAGFRVIGFVDNDPALVGKSLINPKVIGLTSELASLVKRENVDRLVVAMGDRRGQFPTQELLRLSLSGDVSIEESASFYERLTGRVLLDMIRPSWLIFSSRGLHSAFASSWTRQPSGTMAWLRSVYFLDQNRGWVAGSGGTLLQTTDGGETWKRLVPLTRDTLHDVYFADDNVGWLVAERDVLKLKTNDEPRSYLLKTEDGGFSWRRIFLNSKEANVRLVGLVFTDSQHGWALGESGIVFATRDGGEHWVRQASPTRHLLLGGAFALDGHGLLVGAGATIVQTSDAGASWQTGIVRDAENTRFTSASFVMNFGWAVANSGQIFATRDAGHTWFAQRSNVEADLLDVKFINPSQGWAVGANGLILRTTDGGTHWLAESNSSSHLLERVFFVDRDHGWAVGFGGTILKYGLAAAPQLKD